MRDTVRLSEKRVGMYGCTCTCTCRSRDYGAVLENLIYPTDLFPSRFLPIVEICLLIGPERDSGVRVPRPVMHNSPLFAFLEDREIGN